jgi:hypothetical protein
MYIHILSLDTQQIFPRIAYMYGLRLAMDYHLRVIAEAIFHLPNNYCDNLTGSFVSTKATQDAFLKFLMSHRHDFINPTEAHTSLASSCLRYLQLLRIDHRDKVLQLLRIDNRDRVREYAEMHWCSHLCQAQLDETLLKLLYPPYQHHGHIIEEVDRVLEWLNVSSPTTGFNWLLTNGINRHSHLYQQNW